MNRFLKILNTTAAMVALATFFYTPIFAQTDPMLQETTTVTAPTTEIPSVTAYQTPDETIIIEKKTETAEQPEPADPSNEYSLGAEDVISVTVLRHPEVSGDFMISKNGKIQYEFVGDIHVAGLTKEQLASLLAEKLGKYIISPEVNVKIVGYNSKVVYVVGEVGNPGKIYMRGDTITVREALIQAGLPLLSAKSAKSKLITPSNDGTPKEIIVDVNKLLYKGDLRENFAMQPGDTLYIPATLMAKALRVIQPVADPIGSAAGTGSAVAGAGN